MICSITGLQEKPVIDKCTGARIGFVCDVELDTEFAKLCAIIVLGKRKSNSFLVKSIKFRIDWDEIEVIGKDAIIVKGGHKYDALDSGGSMLEKIWG